MAPTATKSNELLFTRGRIISDLNYTMSTLMTDMIHLKLRKLDDQWKEFNENLYEIENCVDQVEEQDAFFALNQKLSDDYDDVKLKFATLLCIEANLENTFEATFIAESDRRCTRNQKKTVIHK